ncbi:STAS/SEC14 domain-containing protein [Stakelama marina]|uniref:STAS/SEC14 domain-containing protein n=1 Tax=Stakelama marina TaxID=2826939 RepID=A0A8T4IHX1_9SPHN|nr:STAS/SEC14 domain-containing protein [Stakelama marina]MBR0553464.1 STAS/SEC14 domain-containing protein [Stakelama marina]
MIDFVTDSQAGVIEFTVDGRISREQYDAVAAEIESQIAQHGKVNIVEIIRDFEGMEPSLWWRDIRWGFDHLSQLSRTAVVTDSGWIGPVSKAVGALMPVDIRVFPMRDLDAARLWVREDRASA